MRICCEPSRATTLTSCATAISTCCVRCVRARLEKNASSSQYSLVRDDLGNVLYLSLNMLRTVLEIVLICVYLSTRICTTSITWGNYRMYLSWGSRASCNVHVFHLNISFVLPYRRHVLSLTVTPTNPTCCPTLLSLCTSIRELHLPVVVVLLGPYMGI